MGKKQLIREKFWDERRPRYDLDFVEVHVSPAELDVFLRDHAERFIRNNDVDEATNTTDSKRHDDMKSEIYDAAKAVLTDKQFQIFILRYKFGLLETQIARRIGVIQPYVSNTLKVCHAKIRIALKLEAKAKRGPRKPSHVSPKKKATKPLKKATKIGKRKA